MRAALLETSRLSSPHLFIGASQQSPHVGDAVGRARAANPFVARQLGNVVGNHRSAVANFAQRPHHLIEIKITFVRERLLKVGKRRRDAPKVDAENLPATTEVTDHLEYVLTHLVAALRPRAHAERQAPVGTALALDRLGDLLRAAVAVVVHQHLRHAVHHGQRRVVGMERQLDARLFGDRQDGLHEVGVIGPNVVSRILTLELLLLDLIAKIGQPKLTSPVAACGRDVSRRVCVGRMEVVARHADPELAQIAQKRVVGFDVLVAPGSAELHVQLPKQTG